jgi:succinate-semialdehyde dehydrogenase/glutarate-semialdehyde dehydrogenase
MNLKDIKLLRQKCYVNGVWTEAINKTTYAVRNPANNNILANVPDFGTEETRKAIDAANNALPRWRKKTAKERSQLLRKWFDLIMESQEDLARILTAEQGKPLAESRGEIAYGASYISWFSEEAKRVYGNIIPSPSNDKKVIVIKEPVGVVVAITPWNFPNAMITRKCAPALAAGCCIVIKPAGVTPLSALAIAELADRAGIPEGVINVITTQKTKEVGNELTSNPIVKKLTFTGSTVIGKQLLKQCANTLKKVSMELGGNAPFIVFEDADLDAAVQGAIASKYRNSGQTCVCTNRFLIQDKIYNTFAEKLSKAVSTLSVGEGTRKGVQQGPLIDQKAVEKIESHIKDALVKGGKVICGGNRHSLGGTYFQPTIITETTTEMHCAGDETFGPLAPLFRFRNEKEAIALANDTEFGLAAYFYTKDISRIWRVAEALEYGMVGINEGIISNEMAPFGGIKESGIGREGSMYGIEDYLEIKYLCLGGLK